VALRRNFVKTSEEKRNLQNITTVSVLFEADIVLEMTTAMKKAKQIESAAAIFLEES